MKVKIKIIMLASLVFITGYSFAQKEYVVKQASLAVEGTSTLHDWEMKAGNVKGQAVLLFENNKLGSIKELSVTLPVESLKSEKEAMDKNAYKSLKSSQYKTITFRFIKTTEITANSVTIEGRLEIAGVAKVVSLTANYTAGGTPHFKGEKALKMSDFKVEPPTFMFGSIKTGDDIKILFDITLSESSIVSTN